MKKNLLNFFLIFCSAAAISAFALCCRASYCLWWLYTENVRFLDVFIDDEFQYGLQLALCNTYLGYSVQAIIATILCGLIAIGAVVAFILTNKNLFTKLRKIKNSYAEKRKASRAQQEDERKATRIAALEEELNKLKKDGE